MALFAEKLNFYVYKVAVYSRNDLLLKIKGMSQVNMNSGFLLYNTPTYVYIFINYIFNTFNFEDWNFAENLFSPDLGLVITMVTTSKHTKICKIIWFLPQNVTPGNRNVSFKTRLKLKIACSATEILTFKHTNIWSISHNISTCAEYRKTHDC